MLLLLLHIVHRSSKLWAFYADLEESLGTLESASAVYDAMLELRVATPQIILNYALMLQVSTSCHNMSQLVICQSASNILLEYLKSLVRMCTASVCFGFLLGFLINCC
jgi:hypothetical protein